MIFNIPHCARWERERERKKSVQLLTRKCKGVFYILYNVSDKKRVIRCTLIYAVTLMHAENVTE